MDDADAFVSSFLEHAGSQYYDPVKAHEYYERTKHLKGRRSASALKSQKQKEGWSYVQSKISESKKAELQAASTTNKSAVEQLRATGAQHRKALIDKIKAIMDQITSNVKTQIDALPKGLSKEERAAKVAAIRNQALGSRDSTKGSRDQERAQITSDLKSSLDDARTKYKKARDDIAAKYEASLQSEFDAIRTNVH